MTVIERTANSIVIQSLLFDRCNRLTQEKAQLVPNSETWRDLHEQWEAALYLANQAQIASQLAIRDLILDWQSQETAPIFSVLTDLDLPNSEQPVQVEMNGELLTVSREQLQDWLADELSRCQSLQIDTLNKLHGMFLG